VGVHGRGEDIQGVAAGLGYAGKHGTVKGTEEARGHASLILIRQKSREGESPGILREEAREPPSDLGEYRAIPYKMQGRVWKVLRQAGLARAQGGQVQLEVEGRCAELAEGLVVGKGEEGTGRMGDHGCEGRNVHRK